MAGGRRRKKITFPNKSKKKAVKKKNASSKDRSKILYSHTSSTSGIKIGSQFSYLGNEQAAKTIDSSDKCMQSHDSHVIQKSNPKQARLKRFHDDLCVDFNDNDDHPAPTKKKKIQTKSSKLEVDTLTSVAELTDIKFRHISTEQLQDTTDIYISSRDMATTWQPVSLPACQLLQEVMECNLKPSLYKLRGSQRKKIEGVLKSLTNQVNTTMKDVSAPTTNRLDSYSSLEEELREKLDECTDLVKKNNVLESKLSIRTKHLELLREKIAKIDEPAEKETISLPFLDIEQCSDEDFVQHLTKFFQEDREQSTSTER